jgi:hypothetical protein
MVLATLRRKPTPQILERTLCCAQFVSASEWKVQFAGRFQDDADVCESGKALLRGKAPKDMTRSMPFRPSAVNSH